MQELLLLYNLKNVDYDSWDPIAKKGLKEDGYEEYLRKMNVLISLNGGCIPDGTRLKAVVTDPVAQITKGNTYLVRGDHNTHTIKIVNDRGRVWGCYNSKFRFPDHLDSDES